MTEPKLTLILERVRPGKRPHCFKFWACRGTSIGCELNPKYVELHEMRPTTVGMPI